MIVVSPTDKWIKEGLQRCRSSLLISSPYVNGYLSEAVSHLEGNVAVTLLTRTTLADFASGASDLGAVCQLAKRTGGILSLSSLHAKVYVFDNMKALVTSANATFSGMYRNRECGFEVTDSQEVGQLSQLICTGFGATPKPQKWTVSDLECLHEPMMALRSAIPKAAKGKEGEIAPPRLRLEQRQFNRLLDGLPGWTKLTLQGLSIINPVVFTMDDVMAACAPLVAAQYPNNHHVREKLRQQMQRLRDLGLVSFLEKGHYELMAKSR